MCVQTIPAYTCKYKQTHIATRYKSAFLTPLASCWSMSKKDWTEFLDFCWSDLRLPVCGRTCWTVEEFCRNWRPIPSLKNHTCALLQRFRIKSIPKIPFFSSTNSERAMTCPANTYISWIKDPVSSSLPPPPPPLYLICQGYDSVVLIILWGWVQGWILLGYLLEACMTCRALPINNDGSRSLFSIRH